MGILMITRKNVFDIDRILHWAGLSICLLLLGVAYYQQYFNGLAPCPLCILQRGCLILLSLFFLIVALKNPIQKTKYVYAGLILFFSILGALIASRQLWIESHPPGTDAMCVPGLKYILSLIPSPEAWRLLVHGTSSCAEINWTFFGLSIAVWTLLTFILLACLALGMIVQKS